MKLKIIVMLTAVTLIGAAWSYETKKKPTLEIVNSQIRDTKPISIKMYEYLKIHAEKYNVPMPIALGIAKEETGYRGPFHWNYNHKQVSSTGACGAMQVLPSTATFIWKRKVTSDELLEDLEFNVETSMKYLSYLHKVNKSWDLALGYYNTGYPIVNSYAIRIINGNS